MHIYIYILYILLYCNDNKEDKIVLHINLLSSRSISVTFAMLTFFFSICLSRLVGDPSTRDYWICRSPGILTTAGSANDKH